MKGKNILQIGAVVVLVIIGLVIGMNRHKPSPAIQPILTPTGNPTGLVSGTFVQPENSAWPKTQSTGYIGVNVSDVTKVDKVVWYLGNTQPQSLKYTENNPSVGDLFQYDWNLKGLTAGKYHWIALVYDDSGNYQLVKNSAGNPYDDMTVD